MTPIFLQRLAELKSNYRNVSQRLLLPRQIRLLFAQPDRPPMEFVETLCANLSKISPLFHPTLYLFCSFGGIAAAQVLYEQNLLSEDNFDALHKSDFLTAVLALRDLKHDGLLNTEDAQLNLNACFTAHQNTGKIAASLRTLNHYGLLTPANRNACIACPDLEFLSCLHEAGMLSTPEETQTKFDLLVLHQAIFSHSEFHRRLYRIRPGRNGLTPAHWNQIIQLCTQHQGAEAAREAVAYSDAS